MLFKNDFYSPPEVYAKEERERRVYILFYSDLTTPCYYERSSIHRRLEQLGVRTRFIRYSRAKQFVYHENDIRLTKRVIYKGKEKFDYSGRFFFV